MNENLSKTLVSYYYVSKNLKTHPEKAIKYIMINREMFKNISDEILEKLKEESGVSEEDLNNVKIGDLSEMGKLNERKN